MLTSFLKKETVTAKIRNPLKNFELSEEEIEIRWDPLLNYTSRISKAKGLNLLPDNKPLSEFVKNAQSCFFCEGRVENQTPMMPEEVDPNGRISVGEALLFPNLSGFGRYSGVCIFSKEHFIPIDRFTQTHIRDALKACQLYFQKNVTHDKQRLFPSINGNYLLPAGSSILHPHIQPFLDPFPTNFHRQLMEKSDQFCKEKETDYWNFLKDAERNGQRFLFESDFSFVFTPFAPLGFNEINAIIGSEQSFIGLGEKVLEDIARVIKRILEFYNRIQHNSFNLVIYSAPTSSIHKMPCLLKMCTRPVFQDFYRNDVTFFEKFHLETMIDKSPEDVAAEFLS